MGHFRSATTGPSLLKSSSPPSHTQSTHSNANTHAQALLSSLPVVALSTHSLRSLTRRKHKRSEVHFYPLRPELIESTYHLHRATKHPQYQRNGMCVRAAHSHKSQLHSHCSVFTCSSCAMLCCVLCACALRGVCCACCVCDAYCACYICYARQALR